MAVSHLFEVGKTSWLRIEGTTVVCPYLRLSGCTSLTGPRNMPLELLPLRALLSHAQYFGSAPWSSMIDRVVRVQVEAAAACTRATAAQAPISSQPCEEIHISHFARHAPLARGCHSHARQLRLFPADRLDIQSRPLRFDCYQIDDETCS